ncbi:peroxiredoxin family protein [Aliamphritea ceti]|uniref:peroxiredoxin family protein n=1 Tax=Aliamphritea ceti TaxID=1524258 RepID=UPI0021C304B3|nr:redoxin domain-containing protein [Aliamphritea ceti]
MNQKSANPNPPTAPVLFADTWLNTNTPISSESFAGKIIVIYAFQMLCPGCVEYSIPQARRVHAAFPEKDVAVLGLHTVFEHHQAMSEVSLRAFVHEYKISFPVAIDAPADNHDDPIPKTMRHYNLQGTPSLLIFDKQGKLRINKMGHEQDLILGAKIAELIYA